MLLRGLIAGLLVVTVAGEAFAIQPDNPYGGGTRLVGPPPAEIPTSARTPQDQARILGQRFAACLIKAHRFGVLKALKSEPWEPGGQKKLLAVVDDRCLDQGQMTIPSGLLRGMVYQQLSRERFASGPPILGPALAYPTGVGGALSDDDRTRIAMLQFADCVARADIGHAHALVVSTPGSPAEDAAVSALTPHFGACVETGAQWTLNRSSIAAVLSEVLYREAVPRK